MKFIKMHVPDKRWNNNRRPIMVHGNLFLWIIWKAISFIREILSNIILLIEKSFKDIEDFTEKEDNAKEE